MYFIWVIDPTTFVWWGRPNFYMTVTLILNISRIRSSVRLQARLAAGGWQHHLVFTSGEETEAFFRHWTDYRFSISLAAFLKKIITTGKHWINTRQRHKGIKARLHLHPIQGLKVVLLFFFCTSQLIKGVWHSYPRRASALCSLLS